MVLKKRFTALGSILKKHPTGQDENIPADLDTPEANATRGVRLFCESAAANSGEEVLHLPTIVENAVASPAAAAAACTQIRKFLSKENYSKPHVQYNAVMLIRILSDNPGQSFTKNMDKGFADTVKHLLRQGQDPSVAQILRETMQSLDREKAYDTNLTALFTMWRKEKTLMENAAKQFGPRTLNAPVWSGAPQQQGTYGPGSHRREKGLPPPIELAGRIEEARTTAKLLLQLVQSTPQNELLANGLVKEFSERCMSAQRSIQGYINCDNPPPDDDTMLTLIETNEQLSLAESKYQRAVLQARRLHGPVPSPPGQATPVPTPPPALPAPGSSFGAPPQPPSTTTAPVLPPLGSSYAKAEPSPPRRNDGPLPLPPSLQAGSSGARQPGPSTDDDDDPFADSYAAPSGPSNGYHPGRMAEPTPSYLGRQDSSANNLTMHGGVRSVGREEDEYARDYPARRQTPPQQPRQLGNDVSPVAERSTVTYRF